MARRPFSENVKSKASMPDVRDGGSSISSCVNADDGIDITYCSAAMHGATRNKQQDTQSGRTNETPSR